MSLFYLTEVGAAPGTPDANKFVFYVKADGLLYFKNDSGVETPFKPIGGGTGDLLSDGSVPLVANWDVGAFKITALQLESDIATGTAPLIVASQTMVTNLNAEMVGGTNLAGIQALINSAVVGLYDHKGAYDASTNTPDLDTAPSGIKKGDAYTVSVAGNFFAVAVEAGDVLIADQDDPVDAGDWTIVQANLTAATIVSQYNSQIAQVSQAEAEAGTVTDDRRWTPERVKQAIDALAGGGLTWSSYSTSQSVVKDTGSVFYNLAATVTATLPASPAVGDSLVVWNNDDDALSAYNVQIDSGGSNEIHEENVSSIPTATLARGQYGVLVCYDAGATKRWHLRRLDLPGSGGGGMTPVFKSANYTAVAGELVYCLTATAAAAFTITLPATPTTGQAVSVWDAEDAAQDYNVTIARNGQTIQGVASDVVLDVSGGRWDLAFDGTTWQASYTTPGASGFTGRESIALPVGAGWGDGTGTPVAVDNATTGQIGAAYIDMPDAANTKLFIIVPMPKRWDAAEDLTLEVAWMPSTTNTGDVAWWLSAGALASGDSVSSGFQTTSNAVQTAPGVTTTFMIHSDDIANTDPNSAKGDWLCVMVQRRGTDAADTFTGTVRFMGAKLTYTTDAPTDD